MKHEYILYKVNGLGLDKVDFFDKLSIEDSRHYMILELNACSEVKGYLKRLKRDIVKIREDLNYGMKLRDLRAEVSIAQPGHIVGAISYEETDGCRIKQFIEDYLTFGLRFVINGAFFDLVKVE